MHADVNGRSHDMNYCFGPWMHNRSTKVFIVDHMSKKSSRKPCHELNENKLEKMIWLSC